MEEGSVLNRKSSLSILAESFVVQSEFRCEGHTHYTCVNYFLKYFEPVVIEY
jgi:hypothetical protein